MRLFCAVCCFTGILWGAVNLSGQEPPFVQTALSTEALVKSAPFTVTVTVDHPNPAEVRVQPPPFSDFLELESVRTEGRFLKNPSSSAPDDEMAHGTVISFVFLPVKSGQFILEPFEIVTPERTAATEPLMLAIRGSPNATLPNLRWRSPPRLVTGEPVSVTLELLNRPDVEKYAENPYFDIEPPHNAIVDRIPLPEKTGAAILRLNIIALNGTNVNVHGKSLYNGKPFSLPPLNFTIAPAAAGSTQTAGASGSAQAAGATGTAQAAGVAGSAQAAGATGTESGRPPAVDWDVLLEAGAGIFQKKYTHTMLEVRSFWQKKSYAEALVCLRQAERGVFLAPAFKNARIQLEESLNLDESTGEGGFMAVFFALTVSFAALAYLLTRRVYAVKAAKATPHLNRGSRGSPQPRAPLFNAPIFLVCAAALLVGAAIAKLTPGAIQNEAVLRETPVYKAPETTAGQGGIGSLPMFDSFPMFGGLPTFHEGQYGTIVSRTDMFFYIKTPAGRAGWVPKDNVIRF
jgi:hypothetical protein